MKMILQHDERDCGAACLAMVANHYGYSESLSVFRDLTNTTQEGTSAYNIISAANDVGLDSDALSGSAEDLLESIEDEEIGFPFIAHMHTEDNLSHFVTVTSMTKDRVDLCDPAKGKVTMTANEFFAHWSGTVITFNPNDTFVKQKATPLSLWGFLHFLKGQISGLIAIVILSIIIAVVGIAGAFSFQLIIDHSSDVVATEAEEHHHEHEIEFFTDSEFLNDFLEEVTEYVEHMTVDTVSTVFAGLVALYAVAAVIQYVRGRMIITMSKKIDMELIPPYFNKIMDLPISSVLKRKTGEYLSRYSDSSAIRTAISTAVITMIIDTIMAIGCGIILFFQNRSLFMVAGIIILLYGLIVTVFRRPIKESNMRFMEKNAYVQSYMKETIDGVETVKAVNGGEQIRSNMRSRFTAYIDSAVKKSHIVLMQDTLITAIESIGIAVIHWKGFLMVASGDLSLGALITFYALLGYLITPVKNLIELQPVMQSGIVAAERLKDILDMKIEDKNGIDMSESGKINDWEVSNVSFGYGIRDNILKNTSFSFKKGDRIALVGESGSGKTTLAKMFTGFYSPDEGCINANGTDIREFSPESLRQSVAYVSNDSSLFSGTIMENLKLGNPDCSDEEIKRACKAAQLSDMITELPGAENFIIEEGGINLSSGQRERIAIARALLRNPQLLILDEATANLDSKTEHNVMNGIRDSYSDITIMMISHRLSSIKDFNRIVVMREGEVVGNAAHSELVRSCETYRCLVSI